MNKLNNNYYLTVSIIFSFLTCLVQFIFWQYDIEKSMFILDDFITGILSIIFLIQSGIYLCCYCLGRALDVNIRPLIILFSFGDLIFILGLALIIAGLAPGDDLKPLKEGWLYFLLLFLSKFLLIFILKRK